MAGNLQPLDQKFPIVTEDGKPTLYFIKWAQQRQIDIGAGITAEQAVKIITQFLADHQLQAGSGITLSPSGNVADSPTIAAEVQAILDQISTTHGTVLFRGGTDWQALAPGTAGQFLKSNGPGADPSWASGGGGGGLVFLGAQVAAASAALDFISLIDPLYDAYLLVFDGLICNTNGATIWLQLSSNNGASWLSAGAYIISSLQIADTGFTSSNSVTSGSGFQMTQAYGTGAVGAAFSGDCTLSNMNKAAVFTAVNFRNSLFKNDGNWWSNVGGGQYNIAAAHNAFRIYPSGGNFTSGEVRLYGYANS